MQHRLKLLKMILLLLQIRCHSMHRRRHLLQRLWLSLRPCLSRSLRCRLRLTPYQCQKLHQRSLP